MSQIVFKKKNFICILVRMFANTSFVKHMKQNRKLHSCVKGFQTASRANVYLTSNFFKSISLVCYNFKMSHTSLKRGAFIVFEGCDKSGKTTQCIKLVEKLKDLGLKAQLMQFPDRTTATGKIINEYLVNKQELPDQAIHLLFTANRWERQCKIRELLYSGVTLVVDRYSYSGVAYSAAKPGMCFEWCKQVEVGLPKPDLVFLLKSSLNSSSRTGFGDERYENNEFLQEVYKNFLKMKAQNWMEIDSGQSIDAVHEVSLEHAKDVITRVQTNKLEELW